MLSFGSCRCCPNSRIPRSDRLGALTRPLQTRALLPKFLCKTKQDRGGHSKKCRQRFQDIGLLEQCRCTTLYRYTFSYCDLFLTVWRNNLISNTHTLVNSSRCSRILLITRPCAANLSHPTLARRVKMGIQRPLTRSPESDLKKNVPTAACRRGWWYWGVSFNVDESMEGNR